MPPCLTAPMPGGRRIAARYSWIETAKLNGLTDVLARIVDHPAKRVADCCFGIGNCGFDSHRHLSRPALPKPPSGYPLTAAPPKNSCYLSELDPENGTVG